jgi:predicted Zn-dependent peptidase
MHPLASALLIAAVTALPATAQDGRIEVPHERYTLGNGMDVILAPDHSLPRVEVNIWYRVGSKDEKPGRSGFAHLFEHLMFMGTERVPSFDVPIEAGGGANNATTSPDRTNYFDWGPAPMLETLLWLEADRLESLDEAMTEEKLETQREIVRNERRQSGENRPYGSADLLVNELLYPPGHPYQISVIGKHEDLLAASVRDVTDFFQRYYVPNNAALCVAGDFDPDHAKQLVERYFGDLPAGPEPPRVRVDPVVLDGERRVVLEDKIQFPRLSMVWHSPAFFHPGDAEMDLLADALTNGRNSRLSRPRWTSSPTRRAACSAASSRCRCTPRPARTWTPSRRRWTRSSRASARRGRRPRSSRGRWPASRRAPSRRSSPCTRGQTA